MSRRLLLRLALVAAAGMALAAYGAFDPARTPWFPRCPFRALTGFDCPGCGSQRALHALLHGDPAGALAHNAALAAVLPLLALLALPRRPGGMAERVHRSPRLPLAVLAATLAWWVGRNIAGV